MTPTNDCNRLEGDSRGEVYQLISPFSGEGIQPPLNVCYIRSPTLRQQLSKCADGPFSGKYWEMHIYAYSLCNEP